MTTLMLLPLEVFRGVMDELVLGCLEDEDVAGMLKVRLVNRHFDRELLSSLFPPGGYRDINDCNTVDNYDGDNHPLHPPHDPPPSGPYHHLHDPHDASSNSPVHTSPHPLPHPDLLTFISTTQQQSRRVNPPTRAAILHSYERFVARVIYRLRRGQGHDADDARNLPGFVNCLLDEIEGWESRIRVHDRSEIKAGGNRGGRGRTDDRGDGVVMGGLESHAGQMGRMLLKPGEREREKRQYSNWKEDKEDKKREREDASCYEEEEGEEALGEGTTVQDTEGDIRKGEERVEDNDYTSARYTQTVSLTTLLSEHLSYLDPERPAPPWDLLSHLYAPVAPSPPLRNDVLLAALATGNTVLAETVVGEINRGVEAAVMGATREVLSLSASQSISPLPSSANNTKNGATSSSTTHQYTIQTPPLLAALLSNSTPTISLVLSTPCLTPLRPKSPAASSFFANPLLARALLRGRGDMVGFVMAHPLFNGGGGSSLTTGDRHATTDDTLVSSPSSPSSGPDTSSLSSPSSPSPSSPSPNTSSPSTPTPDSYFERVHPDLLRAAADMGDADVFRMCRERGVPGYAACFGGLEGGYWGWRMG